jgi:DNA repair protein RecN (Recombination protein N)
MLSRLLVENVALAEHVELEVGSGLTVLTGETGAGKSLVIDALTLLQGGRGALDLIRTGAKAAVIEVTCQVNDTSLRAALEDRGIEPDNDELIFRRLLNRDGRHRHYLNGGQAPALAAAEIALKLFEVHGQHEQQRLLKPAVHLQILDAAAGLNEDVAAYRERYARWRGLIQEETELAALAQERERRLDFLRFQLEELERIAPKPGEWEELDAERKRLEYADKLAALSAEGEFLLYSDDHAVAPRLKVLAKQLDEARRLDDRLESLSQEASEIAVRAEELARNLGDYGRKIEADPGRLNDLHTRLDALAQLRRKYGELEALPTEAAKLRKEHDLLEASDSRLETLRAERAAAESELHAMADALGKKRAQAAPLLARDVETQLRPLGMGEATVEWRCSPEAELGAAGRDRVEVLLSANRGEPPKPLQKVASGGELSRVMLALHTVALQAGGPPCVIFDEIDAGIGGEVGEAVGRALRRVADTRQVICVTHLPQIAVFADSHWTVSKKAVGERTVSQLRRLDGEARLDEIGRMLGGRIDDASREHARVLLARAMGTSRS